MPVVADKQDGEGYDEAHRREQGEAALVDAAKYLDRQGVEYVIYVKTTDKLYARKMRFSTGVSMVDAMHFVACDISGLTHKFSTILAEQVDEEFGGLL